MACPGPTPKKSGACSAPKEVEMSEFLGYALFVFLIFVCVYLLMSGLADKHNTTTRTNKD
jgi:hypothetical protein